MGTHCKSLIAEGYQRDEEQTPDGDDEDDEPLGTRAVSRSRHHSTSLPLPELRGRRGGGWNPLSQPSPSPTRSLTTIDDDGARPGLFGLSVCTSSPTRRVLVWIYSEQLVSSRVPVSPRRGQGMLVGWRLDGSKRPQARQAVHKMRAGAVPLRCVRRRLSGRLSCCARQTLPAVSQASSRPLARGRGMWAWRRRVSRPATPSSRQQHLCNVRATSPPLHAQESSRLGVTETVLTVGFVLGTDGSNFGRRREGDPWGLDPTALSPS